MGRQPVYDIEVEGTHNFIGNGIVAHNTSLGPDAPLSAAPAPPTLPLISGGSHDEPDPPEPETPQAAAGGGVGEEGEKKEPEPSSPARGPIPINDLIKDQPVTPTFTLELADPLGLGLQSALRLIRLVPGWLEQYPSPRVLLIGGTVDECYHLTRRFAGGDIVVVSLGRGHLQAIATHFADVPQVRSRLSLYLADASHLPRELFPDASFDLILASGLDETAFYGRQEAHAALTAMAREEARLVRPDGLVYHFTFEGRSPSSSYHREFLQRGELVAVFPSYLVLFRKPATVNSVPATSGTGTEDVGPATPGTSGPATPTSTTEVIDQTLRTLDNVRDDP